MNREIKFRAWQTFPGINKMISFEQCLQHFRDCYEINLDLFKDQYLVWMQFTGLLDKNGKEIYEGDLCWIKGHICEIRYREQYCDYVFHIIKTNWRLMSVTKSNLTSYRVKIIGNLYENPELLK